MLSIISPAKNQDFNTPVTCPVQSQITFRSQARKLANQLKHYEPRELEQMMKISPKLAQQVFEKYNLFNGHRYDDDNAKQALFAFTGDVYRNIDAAGLERKQINFAQEHLRILSGLYGLLAPMDMIQPYRLEMGTRIQIEGQSLYTFWRPLLNNHLDQLLQQHQNRVIINLASREYAKAVDASAINARWIDIDFKETRNGQYKTMGLYAKRARGMLVRYMLDHAIDTPEGLQAFNQHGYRFNSELSSSQHFVFTR